MKRLLSFRPWGAPAAMDLAVTELAARLQPGQRLLGLDAGAKTIGVAVSDSALRVASPLETIRRGKFGDDAARLAVLCRSEERRVGKEWVISGRTRWLAHH